MRFELIYHPDVLRKDVPHLSHPVRERVKKSIEAKLTLAPEQFGEPLRRSMKGYWKLRVGDYRVIYKTSRQTVTIFRIGHRNEIYQEPPRS